MMTWTEVKRLLQRHKDMFTAPPPHGGITVCHKLWLRQHAASCEASLQRKDPIDVFLLSFITSRWRIQREATKRWKKNLCVASSWLLLTHSCRLVRGCPPSEPSLHHLTLRESYSPLPKTPKHKHTHTNTHQSVSAEKMLQPSHVQQGQWNSSFCSVDWIINHMLSAWITTNVPCSLFCHFQSPPAAGGEALRNPYSRGNKTPDADI